MWRARPVDWLLALVPGLLVVAFSFEAGGFFAGATAVGVVALVVVLVLHVTLAVRPFAGLSVPFVVGAVALGLLAVWTLVSVGWSDAPGRALLEYDRALLYLLAFVTLGLAGRTPARLRLVLRGIALAAFVVCLAGLVTRLLPDVWSVAADRPDRLSFPLTYWNALGLLAAVGLVLCFILSSDVAEHSVGRVLAAGALPVLALTLLYTFSRGALGAGVVGLAAAVVAARPRALPSALVVAVPTVAVAVAAGYGADLLISARPTAPGAVAQGREVAGVVGACTLAALVLRVLLLWLDRPLARLRVPWPRPAVAWTTGVAVVALLAAGAVLAGAPGAIDRQVDRFVAGNQVSGTDVRDRLTSVGNNGRVDHWRVALGGFEREPLHGTGAGTYALLWDRDRPAEFQVEDAHSLYLEMLAELGIVGLGLTIAAVGLVLVGFLTRARGPDRAVGGALFGAGLAWALHAGIDWDWEMPAVTSWLFAAGGLALAASVESPARERTANPDAGQPGRTGGRGLGRVLVALGCLVLAVVPARVFVSDGALKDSARAFARGDCAGAVERGLDATEALASRAEPYAILGYCDVRLGVSLLGVQAMNKAIARDPRNWEYHYGLALARGAAGLNPRPAARRALALNPRAGIAISAVRRFSEAQGPREWRRQALESRLPLD